MFLLGLFYVLFVKTVFGLNGSPYIFANQSIGSPVVSTTSGKFAGFTILQTNVWVGIPYASPPIGVLRWQKAQPYNMTGNQNNTIQNATRYGPSCPQNNQTLLAVEPIDEDCLYLNVWAPRASSPKSTGYPVMLWIHGGGFQEGSGTQVIYDGLDWTNAAIQQNNSFIMVSINYRLNVMGFFAQPSLLDGNGETIANQGITDQRMAMKWVQDNIAQFGGDNNSVTLMGESAGSHSVCLHVASPLSTNLFHAGILESGSCDTIPMMHDTSFAYSTANELGLLVGCNMTNLTQQLYCLQNVSSSLLVAAMANMPIPPSTSPAFKDQEQVGGIFPFNLIFDKVEIPVHPLQAFLSGTFNKVPVLLGANHDELLATILYDSFFHPPTSTEDYLTRVLPIITYNNSELQILYAPNQFNGNYSQAFVALLSQQVFICGARRMAGYMSGQPVYLYTYTHTPEAPWLLTPDLTIWPGAYHASELFNLFQTLTPTFYGNKIFISDEIPLATSLRRYWTNMITTSQPNDNVSLTWPQYSLNNDQVLVLNKNMTSTTFIQVYPNCDLFSEVQVKVFAEYLGLNATCTTGNICSINNSTATTSSTTTISSTSISNHLHYCQLNLLFLLFSCIIILF